MEKKKLGIVLQKSIIRYDVIQFLESLGKYFDLVIIVQNGDKEFVENRLNNFRVVSYTPRRKISDGLWKFIYSYFGYIPKSLNNYKVVHYFAQSKLSSLFKRFVASIKFKLTLILPKFLTYDSYLALLNSDVTIDSSALESVLFFTHVEDDYLLSYLVKKKIPAYIYLYSWDHSCKLKRLPHNAHYFVWNNSVKEDLSSLNNIVAENIKSTGSTQLALITEYQKEKIRTSNNNSQYILFAFSTMYEKLIEDEIGFLFYLKDILRLNNLDFKIFVRAYPNVTNNDIYQSLINDDAFIFFDPTGNKLGDWESINLKYEQIENAIAFFHFGTTLGLEASFFDPPVFLIDFYDYAKNLSGPLSLKKFVHQYQNDKYLNNANSPNVISREEQLLPVLKNLNDGIPDSYKEYSLRIRKQFELKDMDEIASHMYNFMQ